MEQPKAQRSAVAEDLRAPEGANALAFAVLFALATVFLFFSYCMARALIGGFGAGAGTIALAVVSTFLASIFLWWFVPFADFAEIFWVHLPAVRRAARPVPALRLSARGPRRVQRVRARDRASRGMGALAAAGEAALGDSGRGAHRRQRRRRRLVQAR
jgi:hypothetical protein